MKIVVCLKQTFDTEERVKLREGRIVRDGVKLVVNPYDEYAVEEAIRQKERHGGDVLVLTVGSETADSALRTALAMGADRAVRIDPAGLPEPPDEAVTAVLLAAAVRARAPDAQLVLAGYMAVDSGAGQGGPRLAERLGLAHVATVVRLDIDGRRVVAERDAEGDSETVETALPVLITTQQGLNEPRYPSLPGIMKAKKKPLAVLSPDDLGLAAADAGLRPKTVVDELRLPAAKAPGRILPGSPAEQAQALTVLLRDEAKVL